MRHGAALHSAPPRESRDVYKRQLFDKMMRYGVGRGYQASEVYEALQKVLQTMREEEENEEE